MGGRLPPPPPHPLLHLPILWSATVVIASLGWAVHRPCPLYRAPPPRQHNNAHCPPVVQRRPQRRGAHLGVGGDPRRTATTPGSPDELTGCLRRRIRPWPLVGHRGPAPPHALRANPAVHRPNHLDRFVGRPPRSRE